MNRQSRAVSSSRVLAAALALPVTAALACGHAEIPGVPGLPAPPPPVDAEVTVSPPTVAPGAHIEVEAEGLTPNATVQIGFGPPDAWFDVIADARTDAQGRLATHVEVPRRAERGRPYVIVVQDAAANIRVASHPFVAGSPGDRIRVDGRLTDEGVECPAMRGPGGTLYTLAIAELADFEPGDRVRVIGTIAEMAICMQGTTIDVEEIRAR
jgi:hypothetical protein